MEPAAYSARPPVLVSTMAPTLQHPALAAVIEALDALPCGALLIDRGGLIAHTNEPLLKLFDRPAAGVLGQRLVDLFEPGEQRERIEQSIAGGSSPGHTEGDAPRADGSRRVVLYAARQLRGAPPLSDHRLVTALDITKQKAAEERTQRQLREVSKLSDTVLEQALELKHYNERLEEKVRQRTGELHQANMEAIYMLAEASEARDDDTGAHVRRIEEYSRLLALEAGCAPQEAERVGYSAILHDVGKLVTADAVLKKPGGLTDDERKVMQAHTITGERLLSRAPFFALARSIARSHHENWDGSGYPDGLAGEAIPLAARVVHLVDVFDALTSARVYKQPWAPDVALNEIEGASGTMFDPALVAAFRRLYGRGALTGALTVPAAESEEPSSWRTSMR